MKAAALLITVAFALVSCSDDSEPTPDIDAPASIDLSSSAFDEGETIPTKYTCDGDDVSPPLQWTTRPASDFYVVTLTDPDAPGGTFTHWIVHGIRPTESSLQEDSVPSDALEGENDSDDVDYGGPCPPEGDDPHRYVFTVYAIEGQPGPRLVQGASLDEVLDAIECCVAAKGTLTATYGR
ncbi:MAG: YbhB/YbcL family Raf kinase inhibitor-like protein [Actinomycetota bacterium]